MSHHHHLNCNCEPATTSVTQTLDEIEFERGIWTAALYNEIVDLTKFIKNGCVNDRDNFCYTALHYAARNGHVEACKLLINGGADVNAVTSGGATALHRAAMMGHTEVIKLLLAKKPITNRLDSDGQTILHRAVLKGNPDTIELIHNYDSSLKHIKDKSNKTPCDLINDKFPHLKSILLSSTSLSS